MAQLLTNRRGPGPAGEGRGEVARQAKASRSEAHPDPRERVGEVLWKMFSLSVRPWKMRDDNPAEGFLRRAETERERFLSLEEVDRLANALAAAEDQRAATLVRMCMLTGARLARSPAGTFRAVRPQSLKTFSTAPGPPE